MDYAASRRVDIILGTDFMIPSRIRLDLYNTKENLPDEIVVPLIRSSQTGNEPKYGTKVTGGPVDHMNIKGRLFATFKIHCHRPSKFTHEMGVRRLPNPIPTVVFGKDRRELRVRLMSVSSNNGVCQTHFPIIQWILHEALPKK